MPYIKEKRGKHDCRTPSIYSGDRVLKIGSKWQCSECGAIWLAHGFWPFTTEAAYWTRATRLRVWLFMRGK